MGRGQGASTAEAPVARWPHISVVEFDDRTLVVNGSTYHIRGEVIGSLCQVDMNCDLTRDVARPLVAMGFLEPTSGPTSGSNYFLTAAGYELLAQAMKDDPEFELEAVDENVPLFSWRAGKSSGDALSPGEAYWMAKRRR